MIETIIDKQFFEKWKYRDVVMHCPKEEYAEEFCRLMDENGLTWGNGEERYLKNDYWYLHKSTSCYQFNDGKLGNIYWFRSEGYIILEFEDYVIPDKEQDTINSSRLDCLKVKPVLMRSGKQTYTDELFRRMQERRYQIDYNPFLNTQWVDLEDEEEPTDIIKEAINVFRLDFENFIIDRIKEDFHLDIRKTKDYLTFQNNFKVMKNCLGLYAINYEIYSKWTDELLKTYKVKLEGNNDNDCNKV